MSTQDKLSVASLQSGYGGIAAIREVSLNVRAGELTALLGHNGAGKSTVLRTIAGLNRASRGRVVLDGIDITRFAAFRRARMGIGFVQEGKRLFRTRTVEENLIIGAHSLRLRHRELSEAIDEAFDMFPQLVSRRAHLAGALSGGQQQMLAISQALMSKPNLLLIDEPTLGLAPVVSREVLYALRQLPRAGVAVLLVEQSIEQALEVADDVVVIELGQVIFRGRTSDPGTAKAVEQSCSVFRSKR